MTYEDAIHKWIKPAIEKMWNAGKCKEILQAIEPKGDKKCKEIEPKGDKKCTSIKSSKNIRN